MKRTGAAGPLEPVALGANSAAPGFVDHAIGRAQFAAVAPPPVLRRPHRGPPRIGPALLAHKRIQDVCGQTLRAHPGEGTSNRPVGGEIVDVVDEAARGEQRDDLRRRLLGGLFV